MKYIEKALNRFAYNKGYIYKTALIFLLINGLLGFVMTITGFNQIFIISIVFNLFLIPLSYGMYRFTYKVSESKGEIMKRDYLYSYYEKGGTKAIFTSISMFIVYAVPAILFVIVATSMLYEKLENAPMSWEIYLVTNEMTQEIFDYMMSMVQTIIVPIIIFAIAFLYLMMKMIFVQFIFVDEKNEFSGFKVVRRSFALTKKNMKKILGFFLAYAFLSLFVGLVIVFFTINAQTSVGMLFVLVVVEAVIMAYLTCIYHFGVYAIYEDALKLHGEDELTKYNEF